MFLERYDNGIGGNHLILEGDIPQSVGYKSRMLVENDIPDFLRCSIIKNDSRDGYVYDITSFVSLYDLFEGDEMDHRFLCCLINGMASGLEGAAEYLLPPEHIIYDPRHIYVDRERLRILWCYYPGSYTTLSEGMNELAEYILKKADHRDEAAVSLAYGLYKQVVDEDYTLRRLVNESNPVTDTVDDTDDMEEDIYEVSDINDFLLPREDDAPVMPVSGKVITGVCIMVLLSVSIFTFTASLYGGDSLRSLIEMTEMRVLLSLTAAMAVMLPVLIIMKWYNGYRKFQRKLEGMDDSRDDTYMKLSDEKNVQFGWEL